MTDATGSMTGASTPAGNCCSACLSRSATFWRATVRSVPHSNTATMVDSPTMADERTLTTSGVPFSAASMGSASSVSTSSGEKPGASVRMTTCGGAKSGNTSRWMSRAAMTPATAVTITPTTTTSRFCRDH